MKKYTIADVLHKAADDCLIVDPDDELQWQNCKFSCDAISLALSQLDYPFTSYEITTGLKNMDCPVYSFTAFSEVQDTLKRQQYRYAWLKFAALMAEEQGV